MVVLLVDFLCGPSAVDEVRVESGGGLHHDSRHGVCVKLITEHRSPTPCSRMKRRAPALGRSSQIDPPASQRQGRRLTRVSSCLELGDDDSASLRRPPARRAGAHEAGTPVRAVAELRWRRVRRPPTPTLNGHLSLAGRGFNEEGYGSRAGEALGFGAL